MNKTCILFGLALFSSAICILPMTGHAQDAAASVSSFRDNPGHTGYTADSLTTPLTPLWRFTTVPSPNSPASPTYADGVIYFAEAQHVYAVHAADGSLLWEYPDASVATSTFNSTPAVSGGAVYIGSEDDNLYKLDAKTGSLIWNQKVGGAIRGAPVVQDGVVYFGSADNHCYAADAGTGNINWSHATGGAVTATPTLAGKDIYFACSDDNIYCFYAKTGQKEWTLQFSSDPSIAPPVYDNGVLYAVAGDTLYALNGHTGQSIWNRQFEQDISTPPTVGQGLVAVGTVDGTMTGFDLHGRVRWKDSLGYPSSGDPMLASNLLIVPTQHGIIYAVEPSSGKLDWEYVVPASLDKIGDVPAILNLDSAPVLANGNLYVLGDDGTLTAMSPAAIDTVPPVVSDMVPTPGSTVAGTSIYPSATVKDDGSGINPLSISLQVDGQTVPNMVYDAGTSRVLQNTATANGPTLGQLSNGAHEVVLKATDWRGHTVTQSWGFFVDNALDTQSQGLIP